MEPLAKEISKNPTEPKTKLQIQLEHYENIEKYDIVKLLTDNKVRIYLK